MKVNRALAQREREADLLQAAMEFREMSGDSLEELIAAALAYQRATHHLRDTGMIFGRRP